jgi:tetratricopeptide (TPR) repeat protein
MKAATSTERTEAMDVSRRRARVVDRLGHFYGELRRRRVFGFAAGYVVTAWVGIEVASVVLQAFDAPRFVLQVLILGAVALAPVATVLAWFYDLTWHGLVYTDEAAGGATSVASEPEAAVVAAVAPVAAVEGIAERRLVTVLQCSVAPEGAEAEDGRAEHFRAAIPGLAARFDAIVRDVEGYLLPTEGEVFTAYFGVVAAHEDDALRAVLAARHMLEHIGTLNGAAEGAGADALRLRVSAGLHCGHAIVEELPGRAVEHWVSNVGQAQNAAAALQLAAGDGEIRLSREVRTMLHERIQCEPAGQQPLPGVATVPVFRVIGVEVAPSPVFRGAMIGRERELALLEERWEAALDAHGSVVVVRGEPGMGKTRLVARFRELVAARGAARIVALQCSAYFAHTPLHPLLRYVAQSIANASAGQESAVVDAAAIAPWLASQGLDETGLAQIFAEALSPDVQPGASLLEPGKRRERLLQALLRILLREDVPRPVLMLVEDLHWADPTTLDLLELLVGQVPASRALLLLTARPGFHARWAEQSDVLPLSMSRLGRQQSHALVAALDRDAAIDPDLADALVTRADGVPLFLEELTGAVLEEARLCGHGGTPTATLAIPDTLQESLAARIQRLGPSKTLLQLAATIGREFSLALVQASAGLPPERVDELLDQLVDRELVHRRGVGARAGFVFRHALIQEAAYGSMLKSRREECHLQVAKAMERADAPAGHNAELLACHYGAASPTPEHRRKAIDYWLAAAQLAVRRFANVEADHFLDNALQLVQRLPGPQDRDALELRVQVLRIPVLVALHGYSSAQMARASQRALALCDSVEDFELRYMALFSVCVFDMVGGRHLDSHQTALKLARLDTDGGGSLAVESEMLLGLTNFFLGRLAPAEQHLTASIAAYDRDRHGTHAYRFGQDPEIVASSYLSWVLFCRGDEARRADIERRTLERAHNLGHPNSLGFALAWAGWSRVFAEDHDGLEQITRELGALAAEYGLSSFVVQSQVLEALRMSHLGDPAAALPALERGLDAWRGIGSQCFQVCWDVEFARACLAAGQTARAGEILARAATAMEATDERWSESDLHRCRGQLAATRGEREAALACLRQARDVAVREAAWGWNLAAACDIASAADDEDAAGARAVLAQALDPLPAPATGAWARRANALQAALAR